MSNLQLTYIRSGATAVITALAVLYTYYPNEVWITAIISAAATLGIHAIPAIQQGVTTLIPVSTQKGTVTVSEQPEVAPVVAPPTQVNAPHEIDGATLMGVRAPVVDSAPVPTPALVEAVSEPTVPVPAPETATVVGVTVHLSDGTSKTF